MVLFDTHGGLGNQLFSYAFARCVAEHFGMQLRHASHEIAHRVSSGLFSLENCFTLDFNEAGRRIDGTPVEYHARHIQPLEEIDGQRPIWLRGWYERCDQISPYVTHLRGEWIRFKRATPQEDGTAVHVRLGDKGAARLQQRYYLDAIDRIQQDDAAGPVTWFCDELKSPFLRGAIAQRGGSLATGSFLDDFMRMAAFSKIVISDSTYSWWAAWLGRAAHVIALGPGGNAYGGSWQEAGYEDCDYWPQEDRYEFLFGDG